ncbi:hypothetical protein MKW92_021137 [Papaver armeniacum]|nr:hypothetical protein MKW92_021137 [Papaver armeniacum]
MEIVAKTLTGKTITLEAESSEAESSDKACAEFGVGKPQLAGADQILKTAERFGMDAGAVLPHVPHGSTIFALKSVNEIVLVADGKCGEEERINKTRIYGNIGVVMCGIFSDYYPVEKRFRDMTRRSHRGGLAITLERFANEARDILLTRPEQYEENAKTTILLGAVENGIRTIWIATRDTAEVFNGDYIAAGSGGHLVEMYLGEKNYTSAWAIENTLSIAKRCVLISLKDPHTGGIIRVMRISENLAEVVEKFPAAELVMEEEERILKVADGE